MYNTYLRRRQKENYTSYRLRKRTETIIKYLDKSLITKEINYILDIGTADGKILSEIARLFKIRYPFGIDIIEEAVGFTRQLNNNNLKIFFGNAVALPFKDSVFDVLVASAVVEHIKDTEMVLIESNRVLKSGGIFCITMPNPFYDWIQTKLLETYHVKWYRLKKMADIMQHHGFTILESAYFMTWPFGRLPFDYAIEKAFSLMNLDFLLFNYIIIGRKTN